MPRVSFTSALSRHVECPPALVFGATVRDALEAYFAIRPAVRSYVLDEQGSVRAHVVVFVGGDQIRDRARQSDSVKEKDEIWVMQALSGG